MRLENLTVDEIAHVSNGCGPQGYVFPQFLISWLGLRAYCQQHDAVYWSGGSTVCRLNADENFARRISKHGGLFYSLLAVWIYLGVRLLGWAWFHKGAKRGRRELTEEMNALSSLQE